MSAPVPWAWAYVALALVLSALLGARPARAELSAGETCKLSTSVVVKLKSAVRGTVEAELAAGSEVAITDTGIHVTRVRHGDVEALVPTELLEAACVVPRERCVLSSPLKMAALSDGKQKLFRVKAGATLSVLERGPSRTRVLVDGVEGRVSSVQLEEKCRPEGANAGERAPPPVAAVPTGTRVAVLPFAIAPEASAVDARAFEDAFSAALREHRRDAVGPRDPRPNADARRVDPKVHLYEAASTGARMGVPFIITGHLALEGDKRVLSLSLYDVKKGRLVRTVRVRPTYHQKDPWASLASERLSEVVPDAS